MIEESPNKQFCVRTYGVKNYITQKKTYDILHIWKNNIAASYLILSYVNFSVPWCAFLNPVNLFQRQYYGTIKII